MDLSIFGDRPKPLMLSADDQSRKRNQIDFLMNIIDPPPAWMEKLGNQVAFLHDAKVTELIAKGGQVFGQILTPPSSACAPRPVRMVVLNADIQQKRLDTCVWETVEYGVQRQNQPLADNETANPAPQNG